MNLINFIFAFLAFFLIVNGRMHEEQLETGIASGACGSCKIGYNCEIITTNKLVACRIYTAEVCESLKEIDTVDTVTYCGGESQVASGEVKRTKQRGVVTRVNDNDVVVAVQYMVKHPIHGHYVKRILEYHASVQNHITVNLGDTIEIEEIRPDSKTKYWTVVKVITESTVGRVIGNDCFSYNNEPGCTNAFGCEWFSFGSGIVTVGYQTGMCEKKDGYGHAANLGSLKSVNSALKKALKAALK